MSEKPPEAEIRGLLPFLEDILKKEARPVGDMMRIQVLHLTSLSSEDDKWHYQFQAEAVARMLGEGTRAETHKSVIVLLVPQDTYERVLKPQSKGEPMPFRMGRLLRQCGYDGIADELRSRLADDLAKRFDDENGPGKKGGRGR